MKYLGVDYYPEHWGLDLLDQDLEDIKALGCNLIRIADFAWDILEPEEGVYDFTFFDEVIRHVKAHGLKILMCTPTATMPIWLYEKYPSIRFHDETGYEQPFGARRSYCMNSDIYLEKCAGITRALAEHYKDEDTIVAYQMDNEIGHEGSDWCFCDNCKEKFHKYLEEKYHGDIKELNERWGTHFWAHTYQNFKQIPLPRKAFVAHNPSLRLEWERFKSQSAVNFLKQQYLILKEVSPEKTVIHDFSGGCWSKHYDHFEAAKYMDIVAYNNYPVWGGQSEAMKDYEIAFTLDTARGYKNKDFWVTEAIMGAQGHDVIGKAPKPKEAPKWSHLAISHGAETIIFFRYRGYNKGAEQFCFGIVDADNEKRRRYYETQEFFSEAAKRDCPQRKKEACLIYDFDSAAAFRIQRQSDTMDYEKEAQKLYRPFFDRNITVDILNAKSDLSGYKYILLPAMIVMKPDFKERLKQYAAEGATIIMTFRTAWKDEDNNLEFGKRLPADLSDLTGCVIEEHEALLTGQSAKVRYKDTHGKGEVFEECLTLKGATPLLMYEDSSFGEYPAATVHTYGKGKCVYLGTSLEAPLLDKVISDLL